MKLSRPLSLQGHVGAGVKFRPRSEVETTALLARNAVISVSRAANLGRYHSGMQTFSNGFDEINKAFFTYFGVTPNFKIQPLASKERLREAYPQIWKSLEADIDLALWMLNLPAVQWSKLSPWSIEGEKVIDEQIAKIHPWLSSEIRRAIISNANYSMNFK